MPILLPLVAFAVGGLLVTTSSSAGAATTSWTQTDSCVQSGKSLTVHGYNWTRYVTGSGSSYHETDSGWENVKAPNGNNVTYKAAYKIYPNYYPGGRPVYI